MRRLSTFVALSIALALSPQPGDVRAWAAAPSTIVSTIADTSLQDTLREIAFYDRSLSQVFYADDTLLSAVTIWRAPTPAVNATPVRCYILGTRTYLGLIGPDPSVVIFAGSQVSVPFAPDVPIPATVSFDPPVSLPGPGYYAFAMKEDSYFCSGTFVMVIDRSDQ